MQIGQMIAFFDGKVILIKIIKMNGESMSYKYLFLRQELYEKNPLGKIYPSRSLADIVQLYNRKYWVLVVACFISIGLFVTSFLLQYELLKWIFMIILMILAIVSNTFQKSPMRILSPFLTYGIIN